ncbi:MAG: hypothetical protein ACLUFV_06210 [Acutalibacteraceae bacterium]
MSFGLVGARLGHSCSPRIHALLGIPTTASSSWTNRRCGLLRRARFRRRQRHHPLQPPCCRCWIA